MQMQNAVGAIESITKEKLHLEILKKMAPNFNVTRINMSELVPDEPPVKVITKKNTKK